MVSPTTPATHGPGGGRGRLGGVAKRGVVTGGRGHGIGAALVLANGVAACWGVEVEWAWPRVGVATGLGPG